MDLYHFGYRVVQEKTEHMVLFCANFGIK